MEGGRPLYSSSARRTGMVVRLQSAKTPLGLHPLYASAVGVHLLALERLGAEFRAEFVIVLALGLNPNLP